MIKVLHILCAINDGGIEKLLYDYSTNFIEGKVQIEIAANEIAEEGLSKKFAELNVKIHKYTKMRDNFFKSINELNRIIEDGGYDVIHSHLSNRDFLILRYAKKNGIQNRISHSHTTYSNEGKIKKIIRIISGNLTIKNCTLLFACGKDAADSSWGKKKDVIVMKNAINIDKFRFCEETRDVIRRELNIEDKIVIGCVGRLSKQKNQVFLIEIMRVLNRLNPKIHLILVGSGEEETIINRKIKEYNLEKNISLLGVRKDVNHLLCAFDLYILPSIYEGLPISIVEAICSGLKCIVADTITREVNINDMVKYYSLKDSTEVWCQGILDNIASNNLDYRTHTPYYIKEFGYDIKSEARKLENFYIQLVSKK